jgi:hypothetical protein
VLLDTLPKGVAATPSRVLIPTKREALAPRSQIKSSGTAWGDVAWCRKARCILTRYSPLQDLDLRVLPRDPTREFETSLVPSRSAFVIPALSLVKRLPRAQTPPNTVIPTSAMSEPIVWRMVLTQTETRDGRPLVAVIEFHILMSAGGVRCACSGQLRSTGSVSGCRGSIV